MVNKNVLSIKDLKSILNIVKKTSKKKKRRRNKKRLINNNVRSSSLQMIPSNVNNLQSENLLLQNKQLENNLIKNKEDKQAENQLVIANNNNDYTLLNDKINMMQAQGNKLFSDLYSRTKTKSNLSKNISKNMDSSNVIKLDETDSIDVPSTGGSNTFESPVKTPNIEEPNVKYEEIYDSELKNNNITPQANPGKKKTDNNKLIERKKVYSQLMIQLGRTPSETILTQKLTSVNNKIKILQEELLKKK
jgi:hypothetical protein